MFTIRDVIYLAVIAALGLLWFADRTVIDDQLRHTRAALETEKLHNEAIEAPLVEVSADAPGDPTAGQQQRETPSPQAPPSDQPVRPIRLRGR
jgi:hypothetical protein